MPEEPKEKDPAAELKAAVEKVLGSKSKKKLVVAGPGAGKTTLFLQLLEGSKPDSKKHLVVTFINNLKNDLERSLGHLATVFTLHGYCQHLLYRDAEIRTGLTAEFVCYPGLISIVKKDWEWIQESDAPKFVQLMRDLNCSPDQETFWRQRSNYYDSVDFDDSVYRTHQQLAKNPGLVPEYTIVLIDEFQDFNKMEAAIIDLLAERNVIVVAGDDDQALYSQLRGASWDHIRARYEGGKYEIFELPFCMRCPEVIVGAVNDVILKALALKKLEGRINKPYRYYEPVKGEDSRRFPKIELVQTSVQRGNANYFGKYIEECIRAIPIAETEIAKEKNEPVALIIGSNPYRRQVEEHLVAADLLTIPKKEELSEREQAFEILNRKADSNLGWRIILNLGNQNAARDIVRAAADKSCALADLIPEADQQAVLEEMRKWIAGREPKEEKETESTPAVKVTSFEGSKGMSAQYVFLIGIHSGDIPRKATKIEDIEICRFLVGMTRTKKKCFILTTGRFGQDLKQPSEFLSWIDAKRLEKRKIDAAHWKN